MSGGLAFGENPKNQKSRHCSIHENDNMPSFPMTLRTLACLLLSCVMVGCSPVKPLEQKIKAGSSNEFTLWRMHVRQSLDPAQWADVDVAVQEIKIRMMIDRIASGSEAVDEAMRARIDGCSVSEVLKTGFRSKYDRLTGELSELEAVIERNARMKTIPGHTDSEDFMREKRRLQAEDLETILEKLRQVEKKLRVYSPDYLEKEPIQAPSANAPGAPKTGS